MFPRFRETPYGLEVSLIQNRREGGKVRHEHIAGLGAITVPSSAADRIAFWRHLHDRLSALSLCENRATTNRCGPTRSVPAERAEPKVSVEGPPRVEGSHRRVLQGMSQKAGSGHRLVDVDWPRWGYGW